MLSENMGNSMRSLVSPVTSSIFHNIKLNVLSSDSRNLCQSGISFLLIM